MNILCVYECVFGFEEEDTCSLHLINITRTACDCSVQKPNRAHLYFLSHLYCMSSLLPINTADYPLNFEPSHRFYSLFDYVCV